MTRMTPAQRIVNIVRTKYIEAEDAYRKACAEFAGAIASANIWDNYNKDEFNKFMQNPYNVNRARQKKVDTRLHYEHLKETYQLAVDTFVEKLQ